MSKSNLKRPENMTAGGVLVSNQLGKIIHLRVCDRQYLPSITDDPK